MNGYIILEICDGFITGISKIFLDEEIAKQQIKEKSETYRKLDIDTSFRIIERGIV